MRIISGIYGGRKIKPPLKMPYTRPTTDVAKEGLFNILQNNRALDDIKTLDLFGGTGSISYELASRGAADLTIVENDAQMHAFITASIKMLGIENARVIREDVFRFIDQCTEQYDLIFAGPPYALKKLDDIPGLIYSKNLLVKGGWFILEHTPDHKFENHPLFKTARNYGTTVFSIFVNS